MALAAGEALARLGPMGWEVHAGSGDGSWSELSCVGTIPCILTYEGDRHHIALNYMVLIVLVICALFELKDSTKRICSGRAVWQLCVLVLVLVFQVGLCVLVQCTGISIVWNAQACFLLLQRARWRAAHKAAAPKKIEVLEPHHLVHCVEWLIECRPVDHIVHLGVLVAFGVDIYYLRTADALTNVSHGSALLLGALIERRHFQRFGGSLPAPASDQPEASPRRQHHPREYVTLVEP